jgi:pimeloyl-ACP methyl ester carboxylesterase
MRAILNRLAALLAVLALALATGCFSAPVPMRTLSYETPGPPEGKVLCIFFPGRGGDYEDFEQNGFIRELRRRWPASDAICLDAGLGYYRNQTLDERVRIDVLQKTPVARYRRTYLVGLSMGGLGAILTARKYPAGISGIVLISPFLGWDEILEEIEDAGGLKAWNPGPSDELDWERTVWTLLKQQGEGRGQLPPVYLAYGTEDRLGQAHRLLGQVLPPERVLSRPGNHKDEVFSALWTELLPLLQ